MSDPLADHPADHTRGLSAGNAENFLKNYLGAKPLSPTLSMLSTAAKSLNSEPTHETLRRYSAASLSVTQIGELPKPQPPARLSQQVKEAWREIVADFPANHFAGARHLLEMYGETIALSRMLAGMIAQIDPGTPRWRELVRLSVGITGSLLSTATKLPIAPSARKSSTKHESAVRWPWEDVSEPEPTPS
jgi:hypothetical protein